MDNNQTKRVADLTVESLEMLTSRKCFLMTLALPYGDTTRFEPGQFVNVQVPCAPHTFLRRPISVCFAEPGRLTLMVRIAGEGTATLSCMEPGDMLSVVYPLGHGFSLESLAPGSKVLLVGGGIGTAPLLYYGKCLKDKDIDVQYVLGYRTASEIMLAERFAQYGKVEVCTDDGSAGTPGLVTGAKAFDDRYDLIACCGPTPMMKAVAKVAREKDTPCEVSLENMMACGVGACLCCVEKNNEGHNVCVCTEGPVFNINRLPW